MAGTFTSVDEKPLSHSFTRAEIRRLRIVVSMPENMPIAQNTSESNYRKNKERKHEQNERP